MRSRGTLWAYTSARTKRNLAFLWTALFLCSLVLQYVSLATPVPVLAASGLKAGTVQGFEIDGDLKSGDGLSNPGQVPAPLVDTLADGDDWLDGASGTGVVDPENPPRSDLISDPANVADDDQFIGGAKELDTCTWGFDNGPVTGKDDFKHIMAYAKFVGSSAFFYVGAERIINNGDTHIDFELNKNAWTVFPGAGGVAKPDRSVGDLILSLEFANGGANPEMTVYKVTAVSDCLKSGKKAGETVSVSDITTTAAVHSATNFIDLANAGFGYTIPQFEFAEASIDLASLGIQTSCPGLSSGSVRSRAGGDINSSQLKDAASPFPIDLNNCGKIIVEKQTDPDGSSQSFHFDASYDQNGFDLTDGQSNDSGNLEPGTYSVSEQLPENWTQLSATCDDGSAPSAIHLGNNETVRCLFRNRFLPAEVHITKTPDGQTKDAGDSISFVLSWVNSGDGIAKGVVVSDDLPDPAGVEWSISGSTGSGSTCQLGGTSADQTLTCTVGSMASGATGSVTLTSGTTKDSCGVIDNTGRITSTNDGSDQDNGQITVRCPDVKVEKTPDEGDPGNDIDAGDPATFTIKVTNLGPAQATGVVLTDTLPAGSWTIGGPDMAACSIGAGNILSCSFGTLASGETRTVTVTRATTKADCGTIQNTATVSATNEPASKNGNNSDAGEIDVLCAQIDIEKTANPAGPVSAGDPIGFDLVVKNDGAGLAHGVTVSDTLPTGFSWSEDSADCSITAGVLTCSFGDMAPGATRSVHLSTPTDAADCGTVNNTASVGTSNDGSDSDSASVVIQCPDVSVLKTADNSPINAGDTAAYTIVVSNAGPGAAKGVTLNDPLPAGITWAEDSASCSIVANALVCDFGDLAAGATRTVHLTGATDAADCGTLPNTATVAATNEPASVTGNDQSSASIVVQCPDVTVLKTADNSPISAGDTAAFTIVVSNAGPGVAKAVTLDDPLPAGIVWSEDSADCSIASNTLSCSFGDMGVGASRTVHLSGATDAADCGTLPNTATVAATNEPSSKTGNDQSSASIVVQCPDVKVVKTADDSSISSGETAVFKLVVSNIGSGIARNATLNDPLPDGIDWAEDSADCSIAPDQGTTGQVLSCAFGDLVAGATRTITVSGETGSDDCGTLPNTASVAAGNEPAGALGNNQSSASIVVDCPLLDLVKTADKSSVSAGDTIGFTVTVTNNGAGSAFGVTVTDTLPTEAGTSWTIDAANSDAGWSIVGGVLKYGPATLPSGGTVKVHLTSPTTAATCGAVDNTASVITTNAGSDSDSASVQVLCPDVTVDKTADDSPILAGETGSYTITVSNIGQGLAKGVTLSDTLPAGIAWSEDSAACSITGGVLTCAFGDLASGASVTVHVSGTTSVADCGQLPNIATVAATNEAAKDQGNDQDGATIVVQCAGISLVKTAGTAADGDEYVTTPGMVTFTYVVTNTSSAALINIALTDDNATPDDTSDDFAVICPKTSLGAGESMTCSASAEVGFGVRTNIAVVTANPQLQPEASVSDDDDAVVRVPQLTIEKSFTGNSKGTDPILGLPRAAEGDILTYTLAFDLTDGPVTKGVIIDVLPEGLTYVTGSATGDGQFTFTSYDLVTRTLRWDAATVSADGFVTYRVVVAQDSNELPQPLHNVATIDSAETTPDDDDADVVVPGEVLHVTPTPRITPPPTDLAPVAPSTPGFSLMLVVLGLGGLTLAVGFLTPAPAPARHRRDRR